MIYPVLWKERRIPTWLALLILGIGVSVGVAAIQQPRVSYLKATQTIAPQQVQVTNIQTNSFTVSWLTVKPVAGFVKYGENNQIGLIARDARDSLIADFGKHTTHWVTVSGLNPQSTYAFEIQSAGKAFTNNGSPYSVTTAQEIETKPEQGSAIFGAVITPENKPAAGALIYLRAANLSPRSTLVKDTGEWTINMSSARNQDLSRIFKYHPNQQPFELFIQGGDLSAQASLATSSVAFLSGNSQPVPHIILGQDYDFRSMSSPSPSDGRAEGQSNPRVRFDLSPLNLPEDNSVEKAADEQSDKVLGIEATSSPDITLTVIPTLAPISPSMPTNAPTVTPPSAIPISDFRLPTVGLAGIGLMLMGLGIVLVL